MATATPTKTSLENIFILSRLTFTETVNYPGTKLVGVAFKLRKRMKNSPSCVHVLHKTLNLVISRCCFAEDGREVYQNLKCTCSLNLLLCGVVVAVFVA